MADLSNDGTNTPVSHSGSPKTSAARETLRDRFLDWRARMVRHPGFVRWATQFWLTRPIARRKTKALFETVTGFVYTQILTTCVEIRLLDRLVGRSRTPADLAREVGLDGDAMVRLLRAAAALDLVSPRSGGRYGLGELGAALLANPGVSAMIEHHRLLYDDLRDPLALLRDPRVPTGLSRYWAYAQSDRPEALDGEAVGRYSALMDASQGFIADEVLSAYGLAGHELLMDVGGGEGRFAEAALMRFPRLRAQVFDLPGVAVRAKARLAGHQIADRFDAKGGDFFRDRLPTGADIVSLVRILHDHDDEPALALLRQVRQALSPGQTLLIAEPMAETPGAERAGDAYFGFYLLAMRSGRPRTERTLRAFLHETGFGAVKSPRVANPLLTRVLVAKAV